MSVFLEAERGNTDETVLENIELSFVLCEWEVTLHDI
jgi:hypothetical protein